LEKNLPTQKKLQASLPKGRKKKKADAQQEIRKAGWRLACQRRVITEPTGQEAKPSSKASREETKLSDPAAKKKEEQNAMDRPAGEKSGRKNLGKGKPKPGHQSAVLPSMVVRFPP